MSELLLTRQDLCRRLQIGDRTLMRLLPGLVADGLQEVRLGGRGQRPIMRYRAASLDYAIERSARRGEMLGSCDEEPALAAAAG
jgi:hypothetical protein